RLCCVLRLRQVRGHRTHVFRRDRDVRDQAFARHSVVACRIVMRDVPLVSPEEVHAFPRRPDAALLGLRPHLVQLRRRMPPGKRDRTAAPFPHRVANNPQQLIQRRTAQRIAILKYARIHLHQLTRRLSNLIAVTGVVILSGVRQFFSPFVVLLATNGWRTQSKNLSSMHANLAIPIRIRYRTSRPPALSPSPPFSPHAHQTHAASSPAACWQTVPDPATEIAYRARSKLPAAERPVQSPQSPSI